MNDSFYRRFSIIDLLRQSHGLTLMEILVTVAIIGGMVALGTTAIQVLFDVELEKASSELSSTVGYLYGEAARTNQIYRLAIQLDEENYWIESAPNVPETLRYISESDDMKSDEDHDGEVTTEAEAPSDQAQDEDGAVAPSPEGFQPVDDIMVAPKKLKSAFFKDVYVTHIPEKTDQGIVYIYFFPNGATEYAIVNFSDEEETNFYSVEINPLSGKAKIRNDYYENPY